ncbi:MAG: dicarboxylate/amino acid:cation symporter [Elusimicrobia bacterium]|nr:dicarboxylate/amino acid:cation symporter [Elusimicrobiota bacterium]
MPDSDVEGRKGWPLHVRIFAGLILGTVLGLLGKAALGESARLAWFAGNVANPLGQVFLRLVFMAVVPLVVAALALGVAEIGEIGRVGRVGVRTLVLTLVSSSIAVLIGVGAVNFFKPGAGLPAEVRERLMASVQSQTVKTSLENAAKKKTLAQSLVGIIPKNPLADAVDAFEGGLIPLMFFSLMVGLSMSLVGPEKAAPLKALLESLLAVMLRIIEMAMSLAPLGVAGLMFSVSATAGAGALKMLAGYFLLVVAALALHLTVVYSAAVYFIARRDPRDFFRSIVEVMMTAFATSSSNVTLPLSLKAAQENLKLPRDISNFVLTIGATANQNGTALYEGITVLFLAQFFGVDLTIGQQFAVVVMSVLAGVGTAGVPGGSLPLIAVVLQSVGVPGEGIGIILGVDRLLDMSRTVLNVTGDLAIAACVSAMEERAA